MDTHDSTRGQSSSTSFWAQVREAARHKWKYCPILHLQLLIWLPLWIIWDQLGCINNHFSEISEQCLWERPGEMQFTSSQCWIKAALERPTSTIALGTYLMLFRVPDSSRSLVLAFSGLCFTLVYAAGEAVWYRPIGLVLCLAGFFSAAALVRMELRTEEQMAEAAADTKEA
jgi:hypothetical protein